jgi:glyoxylase-like metal-dependent hydrolase (beta-lactamase superfamily II)
MRIETFALGPLSTNCFVLAHDGRALAVDPGGNPLTVLEFLAENGLELALILNTHLHFDHILGNRALNAATGAPILADPAGTVLMQSEIGRGGLMGLPIVPDFEFTELLPGETEFLGLPCRVLPTPGHAPGSLTFYFPQARAAFVGDLIFQRGIGRTDFPGGDLATLLKSVRERIFTLPGDTVLYPGHGPETTVDDERAHNPFLNEEYA